MKTPFHLEDLEDVAAKGCNEPGCDHEDHEHNLPLFLHGFCHKAAGLAVSFKYGDNYLVIACAECSKEVLRVQIDSKGREEH